MFARGRVLILTPGIGIARPRRARRRRGPRRPLLLPGAHDRSHRRVRYRPGRGLQLGDLFAVWGQPLSRHRVCGFRSRAAVRVYVGGRRVHGAPGAVLLRRHAEIVVEIGRYVPPHRFYVFAGGKAATA